MVCNPTISIQKDRAMIYARIGAILYIIWGLCTWAQGSSAFG